MPRIALLIEYAGKSFHGSQLQGAVRTIQLELETALATLIRSSTRVTLSGRTDSGVHAVGQVAHFDLTPNVKVGGSRSLIQSAHKPLDMERLIVALNGLLADDLSVRAGQVVPDDFHARYKATERQYIYRILNRPQRSALLNETHYLVPVPLDLKTMAKCAHYLLGKHDFSAFRSTNSDQSSPVCTITRSELLNLGEGQLEFWIAADHFVYNMVRIIVGTLVQVGLGKTPPESFVEALTKGDRDLAGPTAPAQGLTLDSVKYPDIYKLFCAHRSGLTES